MPDLPRPSHLLATLGLMAAARDLLIAYLGIEVLSFSLYIAVSLGKSDPRSGEAGLKYVLLGGVASAMLLCLYCAAISERSN